MNQITPLVSVLITTYNRSDCLKKAINCVLNQSLTNFELIIIDDCSTDNTAEVVQAFHDPRIRYVRNEVNVGGLKGDRAHVRRFVYELMKGQYFVYLCDDDYWISDTLLERQVQAFKKHPNVAMVIGGQLSYFQISGSDLCLLSTNQAKSLVFHLNGCYCWYQNRLAYISPTGVVTRNINVKKDVIQSILHRAIQHKAFITENRELKFHFSNDEIRQMLSSRKKNQTLPHTPPLTIENIPHIQYKNLHKVQLPRTLFLKRLYQKSFMSSETFLSAFSADPATRNMIVGATLYSKKHFIEAGAMRNEMGSKWQAGYEFLMGPACCGNVVYFDRPEIVVEVRPSNASFRGTQVEHYLDCIKSIGLAFEHPLKTTDSRSKRQLLKSAKQTTLQNITRSFLSNALWIKLSGKLTACDSKNIDKPVRATLAIRTYLSHRIFPKWVDIRYFVLLQLPRWLVKIIVHPKAFLYQAVQLAKKIINVKALIRSVRGELGAMEILLSNAPEVVARIKLEESKE